MISPSEINLRTEESLPDAALRGGNDGAAAAMEYEAIKTEQVLLPSAAQGWRSFPDLLLMKGDGEFQKNVHRALPEIAPSSDLMTLNTEAEIIEIMNGEEVAAVVIDMRAPREDHLNILSQIAQAYPGAPCIIISPTCARTAGTVQIPMDSIRLPEKNITTAPVLNDSGFMKGISVGSFVEFLDSEAKTCTLNVFEPKSARTGSLNFRQGRLFDALTDRCDGLDAALEILSWQQADISITDFCPDIPDRIKTRTQSLLMSVAQRMDEQSTTAA